MKIKDFILKRIEDSTLTKAKKAKLAKQVKDVKLSVSQKWAIRSLLKTSKLLGEEVRLTCSELGEPVDMEISSYKGTLVKKLGAKEGMPRLKILWSDEKTTEAWLYQIDFLKENIHLPAKVREKLAIEKLVGKMAKQQEEQVKALLSDVGFYKNEIKEYNEAIQKNKRKIASKQKKLKEIEGKKFSVNLKEEFALVKKLKTLEDIYISTKGNILALTKDLIIGEGSFKGEHLGRFIIKLNYESSSPYVQINNRDWEYDGTFGHAHLDGDSTCWGANDLEVRELLQDAKIFQLIDFIITFYSTYPQEHGSPHVGYEKWLDVREEVNNDNLLEPKLC